MYIVYDQVTLLGTGVQVHRASYIEQVQGYALSATLRLCAHITSNGTNGTRQIYVCTLHYVPRTSTMYLYLYSRACSMHRLQAPIPSCTSHFHTYTQTHATSAVADIPACRLHLSIHIHVRTRHTRYVATEAKADAARRKCWPRACQHRCHKL